MALQFWLGGERSEKSDKMLEFILKEAAENPDREYLVIVPEQFTLSAQKKLVAMSENHGILNVDVLSFMRMAHRISDEVGAYDSSITILDDMGKNLILQLLAMQDKDSLKVFGKNVDKLGYISKVKSIMSEFMQYGIDERKVAELIDMANAQGNGMLAAKLTDINTLYEAFKEYIRDKYTTTEEILDRLASLIPASDTVKNSVIVFDGFTGFTPVQLKLIGTLMEYTKDMHLSLVCENNREANSEEPKEHELFYLSRRTINVLEKMADERRVRIADYREFDNKDDKAEIDLLKAQNLYDEIKGVVDRIKALVREEGYRYRDISILTGDIEGYRHIVDRIMKQNDIPYFIDKTQPLLLNPFVEYIRSLLAIYTDNFSYEAMFSYLKSGMCDVSSEDVFRLDNYCMAVGIRGNKKWHERFIKTSDYIDADEVLQLEEVRKVIVSCIDRFSEFVSGTNEDGSIKSYVTASTKASVKEYAVALYRLIVAENIEQKLKAMSNDFMENGEMELAQEYGQVYIRVMNALDELVQLIPDERVTVKEFGNLVDAVLNEIRIGIAPKNMDYIQVGDLTRSRVGNVKALFIVGVNDGIIPKVASGGGIINDSDRDFMLKNTPDLIMAPTAREDAYTQRLYVYLAMNKPDRLLCLSYANVGTDGKGLMPSYLIRQVIRENDGINVEDAVSETGRTPENISEAFEIFSFLLQKLADNSISDTEKEMLSVLTQYFLYNEEYSERAKNLIAFALRNTEADENNTIGKAVASALYGREIVGSVTRLETYADCAYRYFLQYGLGLKQREVFEFEARDLGNIYHDTLAEYSLSMRRSGLDWFSVSEEKMCELMNEAVETTVNKLHMSALYSGARTSYMVNRIKRIMRRTAAVLSEQVKRGKFNPKYFEMGFDKLDSINSLVIHLSDDEVMKLKGRIDRIDTYEKGEEVYVKIIDYKSSEKKMDLAAVYEGRQLQLLVYLNAAMENEHNRSGREVVPAGILYYHVDDPMIDGNSPKTDEDIRKEIVKKLRLNGLVNGDDNGRIIEMIDSGLNEGAMLVGVKKNAKGELGASNQIISGEDFEQLGRFVSRKLAGMGRNILDGDISVPQVDGINRFTEPQCSYCDYKAVCNNRILSNDEDNEEAESEDSEVKHTKHKSPAKESIMQLIRDFVEEEN